MPDNVNDTAIGKWDGKGMKNVKYGWLIFAFVMIFNPNLHLIDVLPDFIGFFILAKFVEKAADAAPYFEEARRAFVRLAYISLAKIPALVIMAAVRSKNVMDNDIIALLSLVFTTLELIYLIPAVKNIFNALSYLGERGSVSALVKSGSLISTDALRSFTLVFVIFKSSLYTLPEFLKLTRSTEIGSLYAASSSRFYPTAVVAAMTLGFVLGGVWLYRIIVYARSVKKDGEFYSALGEIANVNSYAEYQKKVYARAVSRTFLFFILSAVFSFNLTFSDYNDVNLLPSFISGIFFSIALIGLIKHAELKKWRLPAVIISVLYNLSALVRWIFEIKFLDSFNYSDLFRSYSETANKEYLKIEIASAVEVVFYAALILIFFKAMKSFTDLRLGIWHDNSSSEVKKRYYKEINTKTVILTVITALVGLLSFANVFVQGNVKIIFTDASNVTMPALFVPSLPWFGLLMTAVSAVYTFYSVYYFNFIKDCEFSVSFLLESET